MRQNLWSAAALVLSQVAFSSALSTHEHLRRAPAPLSLPIVVDALPNPDILSGTNINVGVGVLSSSQCKAGELLAVVADVSIAGAKICACVNVLGRVSCTLSSLSYLA